MKEVKVLRSGRVGNEDNALAPFTLQLDAASPELGYELAAFAT